MKPLFSLGRIVATPGAMEAVESFTSELTILTLLLRHVSGDWGDTLSAGDRLANNAAVNSHERILSAYVLPDGTTIWIITEADRSSTTILLPGEC